MLDTLVNANEKPKEWATVKMIDFAHVFASENGAADDLDHNYLFGIESLVHLFEEILDECSDQ